MLNGLLDLPTWWITRIAGLTSYYLLFAGMFLGILYGAPTLQGTWKNRCYRWHSRTQSAGLIFVLLHLLILVIDHYSPFTWRQLLVPFSYPDHRIPYGLGSLAFYGLVAILLSSDFRLLLPKKLWFALHLLSYPVFFLALIHGIFNGTDTQSPAIFAGYIATAAALLAVTFYRASAESKREHAASA